MALERVPPPDDPVDRYVAPPASRWRWIGAGLGLVAAVGGIWWLVNAVQPPPLPPPTPVPLTAGPSIRMQPSLVVPGPGQQPHPCAEGDVARPDEVVIFRVNVTQPGYVLVGVETSDGKLVRIYGGRPDEKPVSRSELLYEDGLVLAYALERHKGHPVTFVAALSETPWDAIPERIPAVPRRHPDPGSADASGPGAPLLAWDRFTVKVAEQVPVFASSPQ